MKPAVQKSLSEHAYEQIRDAIVSGELAPGSRLRDGELAERLGTSRTPVREALRRLGDEGIVITEPNTATRVAPLDATGAAEAFVVLASLHALATRLGVPKLTAAELSEMEELNRRRRDAAARGEVLPMIELDDAFHGVLVTASGNRELARAIDRLMPKIRRLDLRHFSKLAREEIPDDHDPILSACRAGDALEAARLVEESFLTLGDSAEREIAEELGEPAAEGA